MRSWPGSGNGFTYLELVVALAITVLLCTAGFQALRRGVDALRAIADRGAQEAGLALDILARDLRCAALDAENASMSFVGRNVDGFARLDFIRSGRGDEDLPVSFFVDADKEDRVLRRRAAGQPAHLCQSVLSFECEYFDGSRWSETWGWNGEKGVPATGVRGLPLSVRVTLSVKTTGGERKLRRSLPLMVPVLNRYLHD